MKKGGADRAPFAATAGTMAQCSGFNAPCSVLCQSVLNMPRLDKMTGFIKADEQRVVVDPETAACAQRPVQTFRSIPVGGSQKTDHRITADSDRQVLPQQTAHHRATRTVIFLGGAGGILQTLTAFRPSLRGKDLTHEGPVVKPEAKTCGEQDFCQH